MEYLLKWSNSDRKYISDPQGFTMEFDNSGKLFITNDGRTMGFTVDAKGFDIQPDNKVLAFKDVQYETDDLTITAHYDNTENAYIVNESLENHTLTISAWEL